MFSSCSCEPRSTTRPAFSTMIWSASATADSRWLTMIAVRRLAPLSCPQMRENVRFGARVHSGQRVVEQQQRLFGQQRARDRNSLPLPARKRDAALAHHRFVAVREARDVVMQSRQLCRTFDLRTCCVAARERNVFCQRCRKQERFLRHPTYRTAQRSQCVVVDAVATPRDAALVGRIVAQQQHEQRRLAGSGRPDDSQRLARAQARTTHRRPQARRLIDSGT